jgi:hypothetical protein
MFKKFLSFQNEFRKSNLMTHRQSSIRSKSRWKQCLTWKRWRSPKEACTKSFIFCVILLYTVKSWFVNADEHTLNNCLNNCQIFLCNGFISRWIKTILKFYLIIYYYIPYSHFFEYPGPTTKKHTLFPNQGRDIHISVNMGYFPLTH